METLSKFNFPRKSREAYFSSSKVRVGASSRVFIVFFCNNGFQLFALVVLNQKNTSAYIIVANTLVITSIFILADYTGRASKTDFLWNALHTCMTKLLELAELRIICGVVTDFIYITIQLNQWNVNPTVGQRFQKFPIRYAMYDKQYQVFWLKS